MFFRLLNYKALHPLGWLESWISIIITKLLSWLVVKICLCVIRWHSIGSQDSGSISDDSPCLLKPNLRPVLATSTKIKQ